MKTVLGLSCFLLAAACSKSKGGAEAIRFDAAALGDSATADAGNGAADAGIVSVCDSHDVMCIDQSLEGLLLYEDPAEQTLVTDETGDRSAFYSYVDARAGGQSPSTSYVYARFTDDGLEQVAIGDEAALESTEWDIAFRRFVIRLNSGTSGPGCVVGAPALFDASDEEFDQLTAVPGDLELTEEQYFSGSCELVEDGSGLPGAPATTLAHFWAYGDGGCLEMTHDVYVLALADGRHVKLQVRSYYTPENQEICDSGSPPPMPSGSANIRFRWQFIES